MDSRERDGEIVDAVFRLGAQIADLGDAGNNPAIDRGVVYGMKFDIDDAVMEFRALAERYARERRTAGEQPVEAAPLTVRIPDPPRCPGCDGLILPVRGDPGAGRCGCRAWRTEQRETAESREGAVDFALWWVAGVVVERDPDPTIEVSREALGLPPRS